MKKQARKSTRNRHTGRINFFKQWIIDNATHQGTVGGVHYVGARPNPVKGMTVVFA